MKTIKSISINHLLNQSQKKENQEKLRKLVQPNSNNTFEPSYTAISICYLVKDFPALRFQLVRLGFDVGNLAENDFYGAFRIFLNQRPTGFDVTKGMRIPSTEMCRYMANVSVVFSIATSGNIDLLKRIIKDELVIHDKLINPYGESILHAIAQGGHFEGLKEIQQLYPSLGVQDLNKSTPLHVLIAHSDLNSVKGILRDEELEDLGGGEKDKYGATHAHYFAMRASFEDMQKAKEEGLLDYDLTDNYGNTPWFYMAVAGNIEELRKAEKYFGDRFLYTKNKYGESIWYYAARSGNLEELNKISNVPWMLSTKSGETILHAVAKSGNSDDLRPTQKNLFFRVVDNHTQAFAWADGLITLDPNYKKGTTTGEWITEVNNYYDGKPTQSVFFKFYRNLEKNFNAYYACKEPEGRATNNLELGSKRKKLIDLLYTQKDSVMQPDEDIELGRALSLSEHEEQELRQALLLSAQEYKEKSSRQTFQKPTSEQATNSIGSRDKGKEKVDEETDVLHEGDHGFTSEEEQIQLALALQLEENLLKDTCDKQEKEEDSDDITYEDDDMTYYQDGGNDKEENHASAAEEAFPKEPRLSIFKKNKDEVSNLLAGVKLTLTINGDVRLTFGKNSDPSSFIKYLDKKKIRYTSSETKKNKTNIVLTEREINKLFENNNFYDELAGIGRAIYKPEDNKEPVAQPTQNVKKFIDSEERFFTLRKEKKADTNLPQNSLSK